MTLLEALEHAWLPGNTTPFKILIFRWSGICPT
jgi:hypothetical protein